MMNYYRRKDRQRTTLLQQPPVDRVDPPHEDQRRRKWANRVHPGEPERILRRRDLGVKVLRMRVRRRRLPS